VYRANLLRTVLAHRTQLLDRIVDRTRPTIGAPR
jgi:hypothetical protein